MGGGRQMLQTNVSESKIDPIDHWAGRRGDGRNLINDWVADKKNKKVTYRVVQNSEELKSVNYDETDYLLGIYANGHLPMDFQRDKSLPSLEEMTLAALKILKKSDNGFLLVV